MDMRSGTRLLLALIIGLALGYALARDTKKEQPSPEILEVSPVDRRPGTRTGGRSSGTATISTCVDRRGRSFAWGGDPRVSGMDLPSDTRPPRPSFLRHCGSFAGPVCRDIRAETGSKDDTSSGASEVPAESLPTWKATFRRFRIRSGFSPRAAA